VNADAISHEDYLNAPGESFSLSFDTPGTYGFYCEPHQGAGMAGECSGAAGSSGQRQHTQLGGMRAPSCLQGTSMCARVQLICGGIA
jgi:hypothetical protein